MSPAPQTNPANQSPVPAEGRDSCGRFAKGNPGGPGNPFPRRVAELRQAVLNCVTDEDIMAITRAVMEEASSGNIAAAKLIFQYALGKPGSAPDLDGQQHCGVPAPALPPIVDAIVSATPAAPKANGSNGKIDDKNSPAAPKANGSNGGGTASMGTALPTASPREIDEWTDRQVRRAMEALGQEPLANGL